MGHCTFETRYIHTYICMYVFMCELLGLCMCSALITGKLALDYDYTREA